MELHRADLGNPQAALPQALSAPLAGRHPSALGILPHHRARREQAGAARHGDAEGEPFDVESGLPKSMVQKEKDIPWYQHARDYIEMKWDHSPATTRANLAEAMATVTPIIVKDTKGMADQRLVRRALYSWAFNVKRWDEEPPPDVKEILAWFDRKSLPVSALSEKMLVRRALNACTKRMDGKTSAGSVIARKRAIFHQALGYAVDAEMLAENPMHALQWKAPEKVDEEIDPECVPDPEMAERLLAACARKGPAGATWRRSSAACSTQRRAPAKRSACWSQTCICRVADGERSRSAKAVREPAERGPTRVRLTTGRD